MIDLRHSDNHDAENNVPSKRQDPNYAQVYGDVKKNVLLKFKSLCALEEISLGEALEEAMELWIRERAKQGNSDFE